jgi:hypothetical protein
MFRPKNDTGFSVAEVVIAVAILFFVLTAMIGLMGVSSQMTVQAKQKSVLVNAVASEIDSIRALPFDQIVTGSVERENNGVQIVIDMTVETKQASGKDYYKRVIIEATGILQGRSETYRTTVAIRNPDNNMTLTTDPDAPQIEFTSAAPAADEVLFGTERLVGGSINLTTKSFSPSRNLAEVKYADKNGAPLIMSNGSQGLFTPNANPYYVTTMIWNTNTGSILDGHYSVSVFVEDDQGVPGSTSRRYIIDNYPALAPGVPSGTGVDSSTLALSWGAARDGGNDGQPFWASQYEYTVYREPTLGGGTPTAWPVVKNEIVHAGASTVEAIKNDGPITGIAVVATPGPALDRATKPFSRFFIRVKSGRPRGIGTAYADSTVLAVTRPELICDSSAQSSVEIGAKSGSTYPYNVTLNVALPNFPYSGTPVYVVQSLDLNNASAAWTDMVASPTVTDATGYVTLTGMKKMSLRPYAFRVLVSGIAPSGYAPSGQLPQMITNAGKTPMSVSKTTPYDLTLDWGL